MKNKNNIDQLFERKLNNKSFELKDSYIADFENKLDVYNKKGKGLFWLFFAVASLTIGITYDFLILPNFNPTKKTQSKNNHATTSKHKEKSIKNQTPIKMFDLESIENVQNKDKQTINKNNLIINRTTSRTASVVKLGSNKTEKTNEIIDNNTSSVNQLIPLNKNENIVKDDKENTEQNNRLSSIPKTKTPDVYIDDTIRRQVIIVDTIIRKDTIIIIDTIKRKFNLFKKKKS